MSCAGVPSTRSQGLLTTFNEGAGRVAMHAVRRELVEQQAAAAEAPALDGSVALAMLP